MNQVTPASLRYPLSVFNKNSTLKAHVEEEHFFFVEGALTYMALGVIRGPGRAGVYLYVVLVCAPKSRT